MKPYTQEEKRQAEKKLPKPLYDFLLSPTLIALYGGIQKKHQLNLSQLFVFTELVNDTLLGLESESSLETNLHQALHALTNQQARELVADTNDRIFKEAKRRVQENILEPSEWSEPPEETKLTEEERAEIAAREKIENMRDDDPELLAQEKKDEEDEQKREAEADAELKAALEEAKNDPPLDESVEDADTEEDAETTNNPENAPVPEPSTPSILDEKLGIIPSPSVTKPQDITPNVTLSKLPSTDANSGIRRIAPVIPPASFGSSDEQNTISVPTPSASIGIPSLPTTPSAPAPAPTQAPIAAPSVSAPSSTPTPPSSQPAYGGRADPYREPIE